MPVSRDPKQPIIGGPSAGFAVLFNTLTRRSNLTDADRELAPYIVAAYVAGGQLAGTGDLMPFLQGWHECDGFRSARWRKSYNPAGLGSTDGAWGIDCATPASGIIRQFAHLLVYALPLGGRFTIEQALLMPFDPRLANVIAKNWRGKAPRWVDLNGKWADPGPSYAQNIIQVGIDLGLL